MTNLESYSLTDVGLKREINEDSVGALEPADSTQIKDNGYLYMVADGLGGHQYGEKASRLVVDTLKKLYPEAPKIPVEKRLRDIILRVNQELVGFARKELAEGEKCATTVVAAVIRKGFLTLANVGDSPAYLIRGSKITKLTNDHSIVGEMVRAGAITETEARESKYRNRLSRSIGSDSTLEVELYASLRLRAGDLILLCSDGLTQYASHEVLLDLVTQNSSVREIAERLVKFAKSKGGSDNITVQVIRYGRPVKLFENRKARFVALILLSLMALTSIGLLAWYLWYNLVGSPSGTSVPSSTPTIAVSSTPIVPQSTQTPPPAPSETATFQSAVAPILETPTFSPPAEPPTLSVALICEYTVKQGDNASGVASAFSVTLDQITRKDGSQQDLSQINPGDILLVAGLSPEACLAGGGIQNSNTP